MLNRSQTISIIKQIIAENPDRRNPSVHDQVYYYDPSTDSHCLVGEFFVKIGRSDILEEDVEGNTASVVINTYAPDLVDEDAKRFLHYLQEVADNYIPDTRTPMPLNWNHSAISDFIDRFYVEDTNA